VNAIVAMGDGPGVPTADPIAAARAQDVDDGQLFLGWFVDPPEWLATAPSWAARTYMPAYGLGPATRDGRIGYLPARLGALPALLGEGLRPTVAVVPAVRRGAGWAHLENVGLNDSMASQADRVIVQAVDDAEDVGAPALEGNVVAALDGGRRPSPRVSRSPNAAERRIAELVATLVPDGATVQYGLGTTSEAVIGALSRPVRILSGLVTDVVVDLHDRGLLVGEVAAAYVWGGDPLLDLVRRRRVTPVGVHDLFTTYRPDAIHGFVSINAALQVGLDGSVNIERVAGRQVAGLGGHPDWCAAATSSPGGISIVALASTSRDRSTIVATPDVTSTPRSDIGVVVTEYGIADLRGRTEAERRRALLAIAHPVHREQLARQAAGSGSASPE
jgi:acyl-CoA hydrolase